MNYPEMTFSQLALSLKRHWKAWLLTAAAFTLLGMAAALLYAPSHSAPAAGSAEPLEMPEVEGLEPNGTYYGSYMQELTAGTNGLVQYLQKLSGESTLTEKQAEQLGLLSQRANHFQTKTFADLQWLYGKRDTYYVPTQYFSRAQEELEEQLISLRRQLVLAEAAADLLAGMEAPRVEHEAVMEQYNRLLTQAAKLGEYKNSIEEYESKLELLKNSPAKLRADIQALDQALAGALAELEPLLSDTNQLAAEIARENHLNILIDANAQAIIQHTHSGDDSAEIALLLVLFCGLVGICCGAFLAVCLESGALKGLKKGRPADRS